MGYGGEGDTEPLPLAIAAKPNDESWIAWLSTDRKVYLGQLDCSDKPFGTLTSFDAIDLQDIKADGAGGVLLLTRPGNCKPGGKLCGDSSAESTPCNGMYIVRFDSSGKKVWEQQVTNLAATRGGHSDGALFTWWYQHHGRLATDGKDWAAYFGTAITVQNGNCMDIHEGDRMQVVDASGQLVTNHPDAFAWGCSHSWQARIVWDARVGRFVMTCITDASCGVAQPNPMRPVANGACDGTLFGGDMVRATVPGYWVAWSQGGKVHLSLFEDGKAAKTTIRTGIKAVHPHLALYGDSRMLMTWDSGAATAGQVFNASTGAKIGAQISIAASDHNFQALKSYADRSVAYPAAGSTSTSIKIARVMPPS